jgi:hypothetical protein
LAGIGQELTGQIVRSLHCLQMADDPVCRRPSTNTQIHVDLIISATTFAAFLILGFLEIGQEMYVVAPFDEVVPHHGAAKTPSVTMRTTSVS